MNSSRIPSTCFMAKHVFSIQYVYPDMYTNFSYITPQSTPGQGGGG